MNYEDRTRKIGTWLQDILRRYTPPSGLDNETLKKEMVLIVQDVNKNIPSQYEDADFAMVLDKIDGHVRALHGARTWPTIKIFIQSTKDAVKEHNKAIDVPKRFIAPGGLDPHRAQRQELMLLMRTYGTKRRRSISSCKLLNNRPGAAISPCDFYARPKV